MVKVIFTEPDGTRKETEVQPGLSLLEVARAENLDIEGACEGSLACATCHVILDQASFDKLPAASDDEEDMLDLAFGLEKTSRLGCQVIVTENLEGMQVRIPARNKKTSG